MAKQDETRLCLFDLSLELRLRIYKCSFLQQRVCSCSGPPSWYWGLYAEQCEESMQDFREHRQKYHGLFWGQMELFFASWQVRNEALDAFFEYNKVMVGLVQKYSFAGIIHLDVPNAWTATLRHVDLYTRLDNCDLTQDVAGMIKGLPNLKSMRIIPGWRQLHGLLGVAPQGWSSRWSSVGKAWVLAAILKGLQKEVFVTIAVCTRDEKAYMEGTLAGLHLCPGITRSRANQVRVVRLRDDDVLNSLEWAVMPSDEELDRAIDSPVERHGLCHLFCGDRLTSLEEDRQIAQEVEIDVHGGIDAEQLPPLRPLKCIESVQGLASRLQ